MGPRKKNVRADQLNPQPTPASDYDTDTAALTDATASAMTAAPPVRSNNELNLLVLKRYVPPIERIISIAPFAVVYLFSPESQQWEKCGIEGTLFVCQLQPAEGRVRYNVVILNRKSLDNFVTELVSGDDIEITEQYVILQVMGEDGAPNIYGLWIFSDEKEQVDTREVVANAIQECAVRAEQGRQQDGYGEPAALGLDGAADEVDEEEEAVAPVPVPVPAPAPAPAQSNGAGQQIDLLSLFSKPQPSHELSGAEQMPIPRQSSQPSRFTATADTDFFRSYSSPFVTEQQQSQLPTQQNVLLDLFKSDRKG